MKRTPGRRDQRKFDRRPAALRVMVSTPGHRIQSGILLDSADVSEGGAFLCSDLLFEVGDLLNLEISLPDGHVVKATGKVVRVSRSRGKETLPGMGIEFVRLAMNDRRAIAASLAQLARPATGTA